VRSDELIKMAACGQDLINNIYQVFVCKVPAKIRLC
jgi:hypothetical protein